MKKKKISRPITPKPHGMTGKRNAQSGYEIASERIQMRCTPTEKRFWQSEIDGELSSHLRSLMPQLPAD